MGMERHHILTQPDMFFPLAKRGHINLWSSYALLPNINVLLMHQRCLGSKYINKFKKSNKPKIGRVNNQ